MITQFWEGDIPLRPLYLGVQDEYGNNIGAATFSVQVRLLDTDNREVDLAGAQIITVPGSNEVAFHFPDDRSVFKKHGDYLLQLGLKESGNSERVQWTTPHTIRVRRLGKGGRN